MPKLQESPQLDAAYARLHAEAYAKQIPFTRLVTDAGFKAEHAKNWCCRRGLDYFKGVSQGARIGVCGKRDRSEQLTDLLPDALEKRRAQSRNRPSTKAEVEKRKR